MNGLGMNVVVWSGEGTGDTSGVFFQRYMSGLVVDTTSDVIDGTTTSIGNLLANKGGDGKISLREAITAANNTANVGGPDRIYFNIAGAGPHTINLGSALPDITQAIIIDGTSEPDFAGTPVIELNGTSAGAGTDGLVLAAGSTGSTVRGLTINRFGGSGIEVLSNSNTVAGNLIGVNAAGTAASANGWYGIYVSGTSNTIGGITAGSGNVISGNTLDNVRIEGGATSVTLQGNIIGLNAAATATVVNGGAGVYIATGSNTVGGSVAGARNVISGNADEGILIAGGAGSTVVRGNYIGTDATGMVALGNGSDGIHIQNAGNTIGGATAAERNVISGNTGDGIHLLLGGADNNTIQGNYIGVNATAALGLGNHGQGILINIGPDNNTITGNVIGANFTGGIRLIGNGADNTTNNIIRGNWIGTDSTGTLNLGNVLEGIAIQNGATGTQIGGTAGGQGNVIAFNGTAGVAVYNNSGPATNSTGNSIRGNAIYSNGALGIDLGPDGSFTSGVTLNDTGDGDTGGNRLQNFPVLSGTDIVGGNITIGGKLNSAASTTFNLDFYASTAVDASAYGEGQRYLGSASVTTNASGNAVFSVTLAAAVSAGEYITATATDPTGNTSEFSRAIGTDMLIVDTTSDVSDGTVTSMAALLANRGGDGFISLREAITAANNSANGTAPDRIYFDIAGAGPYTINLGSALPNITQAIIIDGTSEPDFTSRR